MTALVQRVLRVIIYCRVSRDLRGGRSVAQQEAEGRADLAELEEHLGVPVEIVAVLVDNDVGASPHSRGVRKAWPRVLEMVEAGEANMLWTWEGTRAQRDLEKYVALRKLCMRTGVLWRYGGRTYDMGDWRDRRDTARDAIDAEGESDQTRERILRNVRSTAAIGGIHGRRLFGYRRIYDENTGELLGQEPEPLEAEVVRRIFDQYLAGVGARTIARRLNEDGILRPETRRRRNGDPEAQAIRAKWNDAQVWRVLRNPSYLGKRHHHGKVIETGGWTPIISQETWERTQARIAARPRKGRQIGVARLLTGVARCGVCRSRMGCIHDRGGRKVYACKESYCVTRDERRLDDFVTGWVLGRLADPGVGDALDGAPDPAVEAARAQVAELQAELDKAMGMWKAGDLSLESYAEIERDLHRRLDESRRRARQGLVPISIEVPEPERLEDWWQDELAPDRRREVVAALISEVKVLPVGKGRRGFDMADYTRIEPR